MSNYPEFEVTKRFFLGKSEIRIGFTYFLVEREGFACADCGTQIYQIARRPEAIICRTGRKIIEVNFDSKIWNQILERYYNLFQVKNPQYICGTLLDYFEEHSDGIDDGTEYFLSNHEYQFSDNICNGSHNQLAPAFLN